MTLTSLYNLPVLDPAKSHI